MLIPKLESIRLQIYGGEWFLHPSPEERPVLIKQHHERAHQSASTVSKSLKLRYFWPKMDAEGGELVMSLCPRQKSGSSEN
jgi:hypothetical protein